MIVAGSDLDPPRRRADLLTAPLGDGVFVFDAHRVRAHVLNQSAGAVWQRCDGTMTTAAIAASIMASIGLADDAAEGPSFDVHGDVAVSYTHLTLPTILRV